MSKHFATGQLCTTPAAMATFSHEEMHACLNRHIACDWGDLDAHDIRANNRALKDGSRLLSAYVFGKGSESERTLWIITEADRSVTTLLLPSDY